MNDKETSPQIITRIIERVFLKKKYSNAEFSFVVAICKSTLNPNNDSLQLSESTMKSKVKYYMVSFVILWYSNKYLFID